MIRDVTIDSNTVMMTTLKAIWCSSIASSISQTCVFSRIQSMTRDDDDDRDDHDAGVFY